MQFFLVFLALILTSLSVAAPSAVAQDILNDKTQQALQAKLQQNAPQQEPQKTFYINIPRADQLRQVHSIFIEETLLRALNRSKRPNERFELVRLNNYVSQARLITELQRGNSLDVMWTMTSEPRERIMRPIRVPLLKGMLGCRVFLIPKIMQSRFDAVTSREALANLIAGQGSHWPDTKILRHNGFRVATSTQHSALFAMLRAGRFDYFPRGVDEAWNELDAQPQGDLIVESKLMLFYPAPTYFFVNKSNEALALRIEQGLAMMLEDGSFDEYFYGHPMIQHALQQANFAGRLIFILENPLLPSATPLNDPRLWLKELHSKTNQQQATTAVKE